MKRLILVRHGKSSWETNLPDRQRPLKSRGKKDGILVSKAYKETYENPQLVMTSDAVRANTTANIFKATLEIPEDKFIVDPKLYTFDERELKHIIKGCKDSINTLMVFGHNNAMTFLANELGSEYIGNIPTTGLVIIDFKVDRWTQIKEGSTITTIFPKYLK
jgi:phosphohistidine phosphatase